MSAYLSRLISSKSYASLRHLGSEIAQHMPRHPILVTGVADADAHAAPIGAKMGVDRADAVVAGCTAAMLDLQLERGKVELIVEDGERLCGIALVEAHGFGNAAAAFIHESRGFQQQNLGRADATFGGHALKARFERPDVPAFGDGIDGHETDIVPVQRILRAGIAEACEDLHARLLTLNGPKGQ